MTEQFEIVALTDVDVAFIQPVNNEGDVLVRKSITAYKRLDTGKVQEGLFELVAQATPSRGQMYRFSLPSDSLVRMTVHKGEQLTRNFPRQGSFDIFHLKRNGLITPWDITLIHTGFTIVAEQTQRIICECLFCNLFFQQCLQIRILRRLWQIFHPQTPLLALVYSHANQTV